MMSTSGHDTPSACPEVEATNAVPAADVGGWPCQACSIADGGHGPNCPFRTVVEKMQKMEVLLDERITFLDELLCQPTSGSWGSA